MRAAAKWHSNQGGGTILPPRAWYLKFRHVEIFDMSPAPGRWYGT
eukprot:SAG31_NODE_47877_length_210_cov_14.018018_1_plen_44_part_01